MDHVKIIRPGLTMSSLLDEMAQERVPATPSDLPVYQNAGARRDISRVSREELEDRFLRLNEETLQLKQHIHKQDDKIKKLGTKLMRLVKDRGRMEQLAAGGANAPSRLRDIEMEEMMEELQDQVRGLQTENEGLKQRLLVAKQQLLSSPSRRPMPYGQVQSRVNSGLAKLRDDTLSPCQARPRSMRSLDGGGRPPAGQLPRYGHSLLEEARAKIRNLEDVIESQQNHVEELQETSERLTEELEKKKTEYEERLLQVQQHHTSTLKSQVNSNVSMIKLQKQLTDRSNTVTELEGRFLQLQEAQQTLRASHDVAIAKGDELSAQLKDERLKSLELKKQLQSTNITKIQVEQLQERITELEQERDLLMDSNKKLMKSAFDVSQQQKWQLQEKQLKVQIVQLETALKADLVDKNEILDRIKDEREKNEQLTDENKTIQLQFLEQRQQLEELNNRLKFFSRENDYSVAELTDALLLVKKRKSQENGDLGFMAEVEVSSGQDSSVRELRAAHAETIQELEKTRNLLNMESQISKDYKVELETTLQKMSRDKAEYEQQLEQQAQLLDVRAAKITKLEGQLRDIAYGTKAYAFKPNLQAEDKGDEFDETLHLERGENLLELQIVGVTLSPAALQALGDTEPSTFCTYLFYLCELHSTPVVKGHKPRYGFISKYAVSMDENFLDYLHRDSVTVELHQALGLSWRTLATGQLQMRRLLEQDGEIQGSIPLVGTHEDVRYFGSLDYWLRLKISTPETVQRYREKVKAVGGSHSALSKQLPPASNGSGNELFITVQRCADLHSGRPQQPSPYVVYRFFSFPDYPTATVHDRQDPEFSDLKSYSVLMDQDLDQYLKSEELHFYVFDYKEEKLDAYLGKTRVPLRSLAHNQIITGVFELTSPSGLPVGHIEVTLRWKFTYIPPPDSIVTVEERRFFPEDQPAQEPTDETQEQLNMEKQKTDVQLKDVEEMLQDSGDRDLPHSDVAAAVKAPLPKLRGQRTQEKDGLAAKRVTFVDSTPVDDRSPTEEEDDDEEEEEESHVSVGQLVPSSQPFSDDSDISEEIVQDVEEALSAVEQKESTQSDSDDCIVLMRTTGRKLSERVRVEVVSLSLRPQSLLAQDDSVVRLFVEYSFLDLPTEETPVSLPKPPQGRSIIYNYSKVIPVDAENNAARRQLLREVLEGQNPQMERIRFTVVSEPPEDEEQERECEDVGVAFLRIAEILEKQQDLTEARLSVLDVEDSSEVVGTLTVSVEGLEALRAIMEDQVHM
ncbi:protein fantom isoform X2 [Cololabis saira]|uniref:protein fantom isoform X2 n=1 Tax=Cololabis saira TaxID=129043 RepID=UPI002AD2C142|nr:protein fantom isoform X2 [Cololabis saira]